MDFISMERVHSDKPPTGRGKFVFLLLFIDLSSQFIACFALHFVNTQIPNISPIPQIIALLTRSVSDQEIVSTSSQYSYQSPTRTEEQEYIQINKFDYLRLLCKAYFHSGLSQSKTSLQCISNLGGSYSQLNDSSKSDDYMYELLHSSSQDEEIYQEIDSTSIRDRIYSDARTHSVNQRNDLTENIQRKKNSSRATLSPNTKTFRTVSHFGFLSPKCIQKPGDFHLPSYTNYYQPLAREMSIEELFSSNKYVSLPDECIRIILKNKLASYRGFKQSMKKKLKFSSVTENREEDKENPFNKFLDEEAAQLDCPMSYRSCPDLPLCINRKVVYLNNNSDKISSAKDIGAFAPPARSEYSDYGTQSENERLLNRDCHNERDAPVNEMKTQQQYTSSLLDQRLHTLKRSDSDRKIIHHQITLNVDKKKAMNGSDELETQSQDVNNSILEDITNKSRLSKSLPWDREKKLLSRSMRNERKKEFTEIWMNHLQSRKDPNENEHNLSDDRASPYANMDLDPMEEEIISKIDENHLDKDDDSIFTKIKTVIIERSINKMKLNSNEELENIDSSSGFSTSTPKLNRIRFEREERRSAGENSNSSGSNNIFSLRKCYTETSSIENENVDLISQHSLQTSLVSEKLLNLTPDANTPEVQQHDDKSASLNLKSSAKCRKVKRNFIAENIRNASQRKRTPKSYKSTKLVNRSKSAPRLNIDDLRLQRHNAIFEPRPFISETEIDTVTPTEFASTDLEKTLQDFINSARSSTLKKDEKMDELSENVNELKNVVERCEEQIGCLFLDKMEKEIDEIFNLHTEIYKDNAEHKEKYEKKILDDTERLNQLDLDVKDISD